MADNRVFTAEFRIAVAERMLDGESVTAMSQQYQIKRSVLYRWREAYRREGTAGLSRPRGRPPGRAEPAVRPQIAGELATIANNKIADLERRLGQLALENDFLRRAFKQVKAARSNNNAFGETRCMEQ